MKTIGIIFLLLISVLALGCTGKEKPVGTTPSVMITAVETPAGETLTYTFSVGDTNVMFDKNVTLIAFDAEDSYAILDVDGIRYENVGLETDVDIDNSTIKVFDVDDLNQTANISIR